MPTLGIAALNRLTSALLEAAGTPPDLADQVAGVLVDNHLAGHDGHGIGRIPEYLDAIRDGRLDPAGRPAVTLQTATTALVRGHRGFGQVAALAATDVAVELATAQRVAAVSVVETGHTGRLAAFTDRAAIRGVAMFMAVGTVGPRMMAPYGGAAPTMGTNPVAFALPNGSDTPISLDFATSAIAAGKAKVARSRHEQVAANAIMTAAGEPTTDPAELFAGGFLLPFGGHKGYALAVVAELLAGPLVGADAYPGAASECGLFLFAVAADAFRPRADYDRAVDVAAARITAAPPADGFDEVLLPGQPEAVARRTRARSGIEVPDDVWASVSAVAAELGVDPDGFDG